MPSYTFFYARISSADQNFDRQLIQARELGIAQERIYADVASGKVFTREKYKRLLQTIREGDTVVVSSLDRLGRNYRETSEAWEYITKTLKVKMQVLDMPILNTVTDDVTSELIGDLVVKLLAYVADREYQNIKDRQRAGIDAARLRGVYTGRQPVKFDREKFFELYLEIKNGDRTVKSAAKRLGVSVSTFNRLRHEYENKTGRFFVDNSLSDKK